MFKKKFKSKYKKKFKKKIFRKYFKHKKQSRRTFRGLRRFFRKGMVSYKRSRKRYFVWVKRKKNKKLRHKHNFFFFFSRRLKRYPRLVFNWIKFQLRIKKNKPSQLVYLLRNQHSGNFKRRFPFKLSNNNRKKHSLKAKLKKYYMFVNTNRFKALGIKLKKKKNKVFFFFFFLESRLSTVCLRFHFFWRLGQARSWIANGMVSVNNIQIKNACSRIKINDFIKIIGPKSLWINRLVTEYGADTFHTNFFFSFNYSELSYLILSGIVLKIPTQINDLKYLFRRKRKFWIKYKTFLYLTNNFY